MPDNINDYLIRGPDEEKRRLASHSLNTQSSAQTCILSSFFGSCLRAFRALGSLSPLSRLPFPEMPNCNSSGCRSAVTFGESRPKYRSLSSPSARGRGEKLALIFVRLWQDRCSKIDHPHLVLNPSHAPMSNSKLRFAPTSVDHSSYHVRRLQEGCRDPSGRGESALSHLC